VSHAGTMLLTETITRVGLDHALSAALSRWRLRLATHNPAKVLLDLALGLAIGGDCLADVAVLRAEPGVFGLVASDPTVSRTIDRLAGDANAALAANDTARAAARARAWRLADDHAPDHGIDAGSPLVIDVDATLVTAYRAWLSSAMADLEPFSVGQYWGDSDQQNREVRCLTDES
jgi:hypothetical protein